MSKNLEQDLMMAQYIFRHIWKEDSELFVYKGAVWVVDISGAGWLCKRTCYLG